MGLPAFQVVMILARQLARPVADWLMRYGRDHPLFRTKVLIPIGEKMAQLSTRVRMKNLGLGAPTSIAPVSEATALEQASDFFVQATIFVYMVGVTSIYFTYTKATAKEAVTPEELEELKRHLELKFMELDDKLNQIVQQKGIRLKPFIPPSPVSEAPQDSTSDAWFSSISFDMPFLAALKDLFPIKTASDKESSEVNPGLSQLHEKVNQALQEGNIELKTQEPITESLPVKEIEPVQNNQNSPWLSLFSLSHNTSRIEPAEELGKG